MPAKNTLSILFFGDVSGARGRLALQTIIPIWQKKYQPDIIIANVENLAHNKGVTIKTLEEMLSAGVSLMTGGNHIWAKEDIAELARSTSRYALACPINDSRTPIEFKLQKKTVGDTAVIAISVQGQVFMNVDYTSNAFLAMDKILTEIKEPAIILVDIHAETTSEKRALGFYLDGRVSAVVGTHTHVPTSDEQILPKGTAYVTDVGMNGPFESVLGVRKEIIIEKFLTDDKIRHELPESGQLEINAVLLEVDKGSKKATSINHLREIID